MSNEEKEVLNQDTPVQDQELDQTQDSLDSVETQDQVSSETLDQAIEEAEDQVGQLEAEKSRTCVALINANAKTQQNIARKAWQAIS